jgi:hypothetical protein
VTADTMELAVGAAGHPPTLRATVSEQLQLAKTENPQATASHQPRPPNLGLSQVTGVKVRYTRLIHGYLQNGRLPGRGLRKARV